MAAPKPYGWTGPKPLHTWSPMTQTQRPSLGTNDPGRVNDFMEGVHEANKAKLKTAAEMVVAYGAVKAWSAWRHA